MAISDTNPSVPQQVVFIDSNVPDLQDLLNGLQPGEVAFVIDPSSDGVDQIASILASNGLTNLSSISIVGHGAAGAIDLGSTVLNDADLSSHASALAQIGAALAAGGDLQLYACNVASGAGGQQFIADLSRFAGGVEVAASSSDIGQTPTGENWTLDVAAGANGLSAPAPWQIANPFTVAAEASFSGTLTVSNTELWIASTSGANENLIIHSDDTGTGSASNINSLFTPTSANNPSIADGINGLDLIKLDTQDSDFFFASTSSGFPSNIYEGSLSAVLANPSATPSFTELYSDTTNGGAGFFITGLALDPDNSTVYFTDHQSLEKINYGTANQTPTVLGSTTALSDGGQSVFMDGLALDLPHHVAYFASSTSAITTTTTLNGHPDPNDPNGNIHYNDGIGSNAIWETSNLTSSSGANSITFTKLVDVPTSDGIVFGGVGVPGIAVDTTTGTVYFTTQTVSSQNAEGGIFSLNPTTHVITQIWRQTGAAGTLNSGTLNSISVDDATGKYYVSIIGPGGESGGIYVGNLTDIGVAPTLFETMPTYNSGTINPVPDGFSLDNAPTMGAVTGTTAEAFQGGAAITLLTATGADSDTDNDMGDGLTVTITNAQAGDNLFVNGTQSASQDGGKVTVAWDSSTHTLTLRGTDSFAEYQTLLGQLTYQDSGTDNSSGAHPTRTIQYSYYDGLLSSNTQSTTLTIERLPTAVSDNYNVLRGATATGTSGTGGTGVLGNDSDLDGDTITITAVDGVPANVNNAVTGSYGQLTLNSDGSFSYSTNAAAINAAPANSHPVDVFNYTIDDGNGGTATTNVTFTIDRPPTPSPDTYALVEGASVSGTAGAAGTGVLHNDSDPDGDTLTVSEVNNSAGNVGVSTAGTYGHLTLNADGSFTYNADITAAIDGATQGSSPIDQFTYTDSDGQGGTTSVALSFIITRPPVVDLNGADAGTDVTTSFTEQTPTEIAPAATITNLDSAQLVSLTATLTARPDGNGVESLSLDPTAASLATTDGLTVAYTAASGLLSISGPASTADYQSILDGIVYDDTSDIPDTTNRTVTINANNGSSNSTSTATITVTSVNDAPVATITPTSYTGNPNVSIDLKASGLDVSDVDGGAGSETATLSVTGGTLTVTAGGSSAGVSNSGTSSVTITGTVAQIDALLHSDATSTVSYINNTGGSFTLTLAIDDNGFTGTPGHLTAQDTATILLDAPPVVANAGNTVSYTEQQTSPTAIFVDSAITVTDSDSPNLSGATVKITSGQVAGDVLAADTTGTSITAVWNGTDTLTLSGADTPANYQQVLESVTFTTPSDDPTNGGADPSRTIAWTATDDLGVSSAPGTTTTINVTAINDAPTANITQATYAATEGISLDLKGTLAVGDVDGNTGSETVTLSVDLPEGLLNVNPGSSGALVSNSGTNSVTITGTAVQIDALLNTDAGSSVAFIDNNDTPASSVMLTLAINDNGHTGLPNALSAQDTALINITSVNDPPVFTNLGTGPHPHFTEGGSSVVLDGNVTVSDPELQASGNYAGATLTLAREGGANPDDTFAGTGTLDLSDAGPGGNVSLDGGATFIGIYNNPGDGSVSFTFNTNATEADIASVMHQIIYADASDNPPSSVQIDWTFSDGNGQPGGQSQGDTGPTPGIATGSVTVDVTPVDQAPALLNVAVAASYAPGSSGVILSSGLQAYDPDAAPPSPNPGLVSATITIAAGYFAGDELFVNLPTSGGFFQVEEGTVTTNISVTSNASGQLVLGGLDSVLHYQEVLDAVSYHSTVTDPSNGGTDFTRTITWQVSDGALDNSAPSVPHYPETTLGINQPPTVDLDGSTPGDNFTTSFTENGAPIPIGNANLTVTDPDDATADTATIVLTNAKPGDVLSIAGSLPSGITSSIDTSVPGQITITLSGQAAVSDYQTAIGQIRFVSTSDNPTDFGADTSRTVTVQVSNEDAGNVAQATIQIIAVNDPPVLSNVAASASVAFAGQTVTVSSGLTVSDVDNTTLAGATVAITAGTFAGDGDVLAANVAGTSITATYIAATETLTLSGTDTLAHYQQVLDSVSFHSTSADPTNSNADPTRTVTWQLNDGSAANNLSATATTTIDLRPSPTNDFNGDKISDLVFQNTGLGDNGILIDLMNGTTITSSATISNFTDLQFEASGDFNHDGKADIVLQSSDGTPQIWFMNGTSVTSTVTLSDPGPSWHIIATGDFNGDGNTDILWQASDGTPGIWEMNGTTVIGGGVLANPGTGWHIIGAGDFNGDGKSDILWQATDGTPGIWEMNGTTVIGGGTVTNPGAIWQLKDDGPFGTDQNGVQNSAGSTGLGLSTTSISPDNSRGFTAAAPPGSTVPPPNRQDTSTLHLSAPDCLVSTPILGADAPAYSTKMLANSA